MILPTLRGETPTAEIKADNPLEDTLNLLNFIGSKHTEYAYAIEDLQYQQVTTIGKKIPNSEFELRS